MKTTSLTKGSTCLGHPAVGFVSPWTSRNHTLQSEGISISHHMHLTDAYGQNLISVVFYEVHGDTQDLFF